MRVGLISDRVSSVDHLYTTVASRHDVKSFEVGDSAKGLIDIDILVICVSLRDENRICDLRRMISETRNARGRLFILTNKSRLLNAQAYALGATDILVEPVDPLALLKKIEAAKDHSLDLATDQAIPLQPLLCGAAGLASLFSSAAKNDGLSIMDASVMTEQVLDTLVEHGLSAWLDSVRRHHAGTFQHCLLVTGLALDFGRSLNFSRADTLTLGLAATLHDIGKAKVPIEILNKAGKLDAAERMLIELHPVAGYELLKETSGVSSEVLSAVRHHHEYLDGSGYPDGIAAHEIRDLVRLLTISDIFAALIEDRRYKPPLPRREAYNILLAMDGKLESALVAAFRDVGLHR